MSAVNSELMIFDGTCYPPTISVKNSVWQRDIITNRQLRILFDDILLQAISSGRPISADRVLGVLSHWITEPHIDWNAVQHTYALRMRLDAYLYRYSIDHGQPDVGLLKLLGACSIGRQIALRLTSSFELNENAPWQLYTLWDWVESKDGNHMVCAIGTTVADVRLNIRYIDLERNMLRVLLVGADLWPEAYPVLNMTTVTTMVMEGYTVDAAVQLASAAKPGGSLRSSSLIAFT